MGTPSYGASWLRVPKVPLVRPSWNISCRATSRAMLVWRVTSRLTSTHLPTGAPPTDWPLGVLVIPPKGGLLMMPLATVPPKALLLRLWISSKGARLPQTLVTPVKHPPTQVWTALENAVITKCPPMTAKPPAPLPLPPVNATVGIEV